MRVCPFRHRYSSSGVVDFEVVRCWFEDTLNGLRHLHNGGARPLLHRNLKPANLLVFNTGNPSRPYRVKLDDLQVPMDADSESFPTGTPFTMAPEVFDGAYYPASDMFSWGITMCCAVVQAMDGVADPLESYSGDREGLVTRAVSIVSPHSPSLADLLSRCCNTDHTTRPTASDALGTVYAAAARGVEAPVPAPPQAQQVSSCAAFAVLDKHIT